MEYAKYLEIIESKSDSLSHEEKVAMCLMCCNRLAPLYTKFSLVEKWGDAGLLTKCREKAANWIIDSKSEAEIFREDLEKIIPDSEDFGSILGSYAQNASIAHWYLLDQLATNDRQPLVWVLNKCYDTLDFYVQEILDPNMEGNLPASQIENHPALVEEVFWQIEKLESVKNNSNLPKFIEQYKNEAILDVA